MPNYGVWKPLVVAKVQIEAPYWPVLVGRRRLMRTARMIRAMSPERGVTS